MSKTFVLKLHVLLFSFPLLPLPPWSVKWKVGLKSKDEGTVWPRGI